LTLGKHSQAKAAKQSFDLKISAATVQPTSISPRSIDVPQQAAQEQPYGDELNVVEFFGAALHTQMTHYK
jgi:hypothetical protein